MRECIVRFLVEYNTGPGERQGGEWIPVESCLTVELGRKALKRYRCALGGHYPVRLIRRTVEILDQPNQETKKKGQK